MRRFASVLKLNARLDERVVKAIQISSLWLLRGVTSIMLGRSCGCGATIISLLVLDISNSIFADNKMMIRTFKSPGIAVVFSLFACGLGLAQPSTYEDADKPGFILDAPAPDIFLTGLQYAYDASGEVLTVVGNASQLRHGGSNGDNASATQENIYSELRIGSITQGTFFLTANVDNTGNFQAGSLIVNGGIIGSQGTATDGGINWILDSPFNPFPFGEAGPNPLLTANLTNLLFDNTADQAGDFSDTVYLTYVTAGGELANGNSGIDFAEAGTYGGIIFDGFSTISNLGQSAWLNDFDNFGGQGDLGLGIVPEPSALILVGLMVGICGSFRKRK